MPSKKTPSTTEVQPEEAPEMTPSEIIDAQIEADELRRELLSDLPPLLAPERFRLRHRNRMMELTLDAYASGAFEREKLEFDPTDPADVESLKKLNAFVESIDEWAESIALDPDAYASWSEGKTQEHFVALFAQYRDALGESSSSAD